MHDFIINVSSSFREKNQNIVSNSSLFLQNTIAPEEIRSWVFLVTEFFFLITVSKCQCILEVGWIKREEYKKTRSEKMFENIFIIFNFLTKTLFIVYVQLLF